MSLYDRIADLGLSIEAIEFERLERDTSSGFTRVSTVVLLRGDGHVGRGEDVTYDEPDHAAFHEWVGEEPSSLDVLRGRHTVDSFGDAVATLDLFPNGPRRSHAEHFRQWAFESAALDLALRQADETLGDVLDREYRPVEFVTSARLGDPPSADRVHALREAVPGIEFKLDPTPAWDDEIIAELAASGAVRILDLKGLYEHEELEAIQDPDRYRTLFEAFPDAIIEDPAITEETRPLLDTVLDRLSWDYPIVDRESFAAKAADPGAPYCNVKPSRFGRLDSLFRFLEDALERGVTLYGGGQFELGAGRGQVQALASLFYPDGPNDIAPRAYNDPGVPKDPPAPPLDPGAPEPGFGFRNPTW